MAAPTATLLTTVAIGNREDLSDTIYRIDPSDTPIVTMMDRETAIATNHEWETQALATPSTTNFQLEGDDVVADAVVVTVRLGNICQISRKAASVSGTQLAVKHAGRENELDYQMTLKGLELKRDIETTIAGTNVAKVATDPRKTATILSWIKTNTNKGGGAGADPGTADGAAIRTDGTQRALDESMLKDVLSKCWIAGGKPDNIFVGASTSRRSQTSLVVRPRWSRPARRRSRQ